MTLLKIHTKIFISHSSVNNEIVKKIEKVINQYQIDYWVDYNQGENGIALNRKINEGLKESTHFFLIWSSDAEKSDWVKDEIDLVMTPPYKENISRTILLLENIAPPLGFATYQNKIDDSNVTSIVRDILKELLEVDVDLLDEFDESLDLSFDEIELDDTYYSFSLVLKRVDFARYNIMFHEYLAQKLEQEKEESKND